MLNILGSAKKLCAGLTRRDMIHVGSLGMLGIGLPDMFRLKHAQAETGNVPNGPFGKAKSCILLLPYGSPPQHETFEVHPAGVGVYPTS